MSLVSIATLSLWLVFTSNPTSLKKDGMKIDSTMTVCVCQLLLSFLHVSSLFLLLVRLFCFVLFILFVVVGLFD